MRDGLKMNWVDAPGVLAAVVDFGTNWDLAAVQPVRYPVSLLGALAIP